MKNAIILHGRPDKEEYYNPDYPAQSNANWIGWLHKQLQRKDIFTQAPEIPMSFRPDYKTWKTEFERYDIGPNTLLVGHSCGGGFLVRWLSENPGTSVGKVVLVAPWINPDNNPDSNAGSFFDFEIDPELASRAGKLIIFGSDNDFSSIKASVKILSEKIKGIEFREFHNYGHFSYEDLKTDKFPELLEECLSSE